MVMFTDAKSARSRQQFLKGFRTGMPVMLGYLPISFAFAITATAGGNGLPWYLVVAICMSNFTSAGQAAGTGLLLAGSPLSEIGITVFVINIRYMLMSLSLSQKMLNMPLFKRLLLANGITDEIFFLAMREEGQLSGWFFTGLSFGPYLGWALGGLLGALAGAILPASLASALGIALYAMFIAIVIPAARDSKQITAVVILAVTFACIFRYLPYVNQIPSGWSLILSAVIASALGAFLFSPREKSEVTA